MQHWLKPLLESVRLVHCQASNPPPAFFLNEIAKTRLSNPDDPEKLCLTQPDLFIRVKPNKEDNHGYAGFLTHSLVWCIGPAVLDSLNGQRGQDYFTIDASTSEEEFTEKHVSKLCQFLYSGELAFEKSDQNTMIMMANDFGIDAFNIAVKQVKDRAEQDSNNPFKEKVENNKKFGKHRSDSQKSAKNKTVGKNRGEGGNKLKENFKDFKAMLEFMKMMKN